MGDPATISA